VGITGFMGVLTGGVFALGLVPFTRTIVPGAAHYSLVFDDGAAQAVITVPPSITPSEVEPTLRQAAGDLLLRYGRLSRGGTLPIVRMRTLLHPELGISQPLFLGQAQRNISDATDPVKVEIFADKLASLPHSDRS
jgi:hypothetical protein